MDGLADADSPIPERGDLCFLSALCALSPPGLGGCCSLRRDSAPEATGGGYGGPTAGDSRARLELSPLFYEDAQIFAINLLEHASSPRLI